MVQGGKSFLTGTRNDGLSFLLTAMYCGSESVEMATVLLDAVGSKFHIFFPLAHVVKTLVDVGASGLKMIVFPGKYPDSTPGPVNLYCQLGKTLLFGQNGQLTPQTWTSSIDMYDVSHSYMQHD